MCDLNVAGAAEYLGIVGNLIVQQAFRQHRGANRGI